MSVYNGEPHLRDAIESILCQTFSDFVFLIINDGSTDLSRDVIISFGDDRINLIDNISRLGLTKSLNRGLAHAKGELVARQDADDVSYLTRLEKEVKFLESNPKIALLGARARAIDGYGKPKSIELNIPSGLLAIRWFLMFQNPFIHSSVMFRRNVIWEKLGGYDESYEKAQDYELWSRVARTYETENLPEILIDHRFEYGSVVSKLKTSVPIDEDIVHKNLKEFLKDRKISIEWARIITHLNRKEYFSNSTDWKSVAAFYSQVYERYCRLYPEARLEPEVRLNLANSLYWIAYYSAHQNRIISLRTYNQARKHSPRNKECPSLAKYVALWIAKERIKNVYGRFRSHHFF